MRKRLFIFVLMIVSLLSAVPVAAAAPKADELNDDQLSQIKQNCGRAQAVLRSVQKRDTVLRINRGRLYDMTLRQTGAFVSRLNVHKIDAPAIKSAESSIRAEYQKFMTDYDHYGDNLEIAVTIDCADKPQEFYAALQQAAHDRQTVAKDVAEIKQHLSEYTSELGKLREQKFSEGSEQ